MMDQIHFPSNHLTRSNLVVGVANRIGNWIISNPIKPGERLPSEIELMQHFGVARTVIREAIARLSALNIVSTQHGKGTFVTNASPEILLARIRLLDQEHEDILPDLWEMREIMETHIAAFAAIRRTEEDLYHLDQTLEKMRMALDRGELGIEEDDLFHYYLTQAAHNKVIGQVMLGLAPMIEPNKRDSQEQPFEPEATYQELTGVLEAVKQKDPPAAKKAIRRHLEQSRGSTFAADTQVGFNDGSP